MNIVDYMKSRRKDDRFILEALEQAARAKSQGDLPIGALLLLPSKTLSECNTVWSEGDQTNHAEINVMRKASQMGFRKMNNGILYATVEPCIMCSAAATEYGISEIVFGAYDVKRGFHSSKLLNSVPFTFKGGIMARDCIEILPSYFQKDLRETDESV